MADRSARINEAERLVGHLRMFEHATDILKQAQADEAEISNREKKLNRLQTEIQQLEEDVAAAQEDLKTLKTRKEEQTRKLEQEQADRVTRATHEADAELAAIEKDRKTRIRHLDQMVAQHQAKERKAREDAAAAVADLEEKRKARDDFVRRVTR